MVRWKIVFTKQAIKDVEKIACSPLKDKVKLILNALEESPYYSPPPYEKLLGDLAGAYSRRINIQHRLVYQVFEKEHVIKIIPISKTFNAS